MKINKCPFCGSKAAVTGLFSKYRYVKCDDGACVFDACVLIGPSRKTKADAIRAWNSILVVKENKKKVKHG